MEYSAIYDWLIQQVSANQFFAGGLVMGLIGWLAMAAREWPQKVGAFVARQTMTELTIRSTDGEAFMHVALWLAKHKSRAGARRLGIIDYWDNDSDDPDGDYEVTFGFGNHMLWDKWFPVFVNRSMAEGNPGQTPVQVLTLRMFGRTHTRILKLVNDARIGAKSSNRIAIRIWNGDFYQTVDRREPRPMSSVIMPARDKDALIADVVGFRAGREWYTERGLPWRRGYLLEGPPGTGKSSLIMALSGVARKGVYIINPQTVGNDNELLKAFSEAGDGIVVIEDIDAIEVSNTRATEELEPGKKPKASERGPKGITLSGLLNAVDGVAARDGRILFITSNHPDKLDAALIRPGRVDLRVHLGLMTRDLGAEMFDRFFTGECPEAFLSSVAWPQSPARVQGLLLKWHEERIIPIDAAKPSRHGPPCRGTNSAEG